MRNRVPAKREERAPLPAFTPVPRKYRHDGWTPERQRAFIEALADTGSVTRAAAQVNMAQANCYTLRRAAGAEGFRRAWDAALDFGVKRLKDVAFERALEGQLVPVFVGGKLMGFRRKRNDALLMFCLRHYGEDAEGRRTTVNYFSARVGAVAGEVGAGGESPSTIGRSGPMVPLPEQARGGQAVAEASATSVRAVVTGPSTFRHGSGKASLGTGGGLEGAAETLNGFDGVALDARAEAEIRAALEACALRAREGEAALEAGGRRAIAAGIGDAGESFVRVGERDNPFHGELLPPVALEDGGGFAAGESHWTLAGADMPEWAAEVKRLEEERAVKDEKRRADDRRRYRARKARRLAAGEVGPQPASSGKEPLEPLPAPPGSSPG